MTATPCNRVVFVLGNRWVESNVEVMSGRCETEGTTVMGEVVRVQGDFGGGTIGAEQTHLSISATHNAGARPPEHNSFQYPQTTCQN